MEGKLSYIMRKFCFTALMYENFDGSMHVICFLGTTTYKFRTMLILPNALYIIRSIAIFDTSITTTMLCFPCKQYSSRTKVTKSLTLIECLHQIYSFLAFFSVTL
jgi:hypothetical protein